MGPPPRCPRLCGLPRGVRRAPGRHPGGDAEARLLRHHRRPWQRSDLPGLRSHPRACADPRYRRRRARWPDWRTVEPCRRRRDDRDEARPAEGTAWGGLGRMSFALDERLKRDTFVVGDMTLSRILLMNDARWP